VAKQHALASLGVSATEEGVYRYFLRHPARKVESAADSIGVDHEVAHVLLRRLRRLGLVRLVDGRGVVAVAPEVGVQRLIEQRMHELNEELLRVNAVRIAIPNLLVDANTSTERAEPLDIQRVTEPDQIRAVQDDLADFARREVLILRTDAPLTPDEIAEALDRDLPCLRRGVALRLVVSADAVADLDNREYLRELTGHGAQVRVMDASMERLTAYDQRVAVVPEDPADAASGALVIRLSGLVSQMTLLFEQVWTGAEEPRLADADHGEPLSDEDREVLAMLTLVNKDDVAAKKIGISVRTFRRRVAELMNRLGASNRFQAALLAKDRGWV